LYTASVIKNFLGHKTTGCIAQDLFTTDRILQRWAVSIGSGLPTETWDEIPRAKLPPLPDDIAILIDRTVLKAPRRQRMIINMWYRSAAPTQVMARRLNLSTTSLKAEMNGALAWCREKFLALNNSWLHKSLLLEHAVAA
jgi:hypothetical protein